MRTTSPSRAANKETQLATDFADGTDNTMHSSVTSVQSVAKTSSHAQRKSMDRGTVLLAAILIGLCCRLATHFAHKPPAHPTCVTRYSTAMRTASPLVTCVSIPDCGPSAIAELISIPRFIGPGCMINTSFLHR